MKRHLSRVLEPHSEPRKSKEWLWLTLVALVVGMFWGLVR